jgi:predicted AAA+ superfamily ATPase
MVAGGFPGLRRLTGRALTTQLDSYLDRIVDHDLPEVGFHVRSPTTVMAWLRAYAAAIGTTTTWDKIRNAASAGTDSKPAKTTTLPYIELLTLLRILDPLPAWLPSNNHLSSLTEAPKHYLADPALAARLVRLSATRLLAGNNPDSQIPRDGTYLGALFEALAVLSVRTFAQRYGARTHHLRTKGGRHEVDMIVESDEGVVGLEVKLSSTVGDGDVAHLRWLREQLPDQVTNLVLLNTGPEAYRRKDGVLVVPLGLLGV